MDGFYFKWEEDFCTGVDVPTITLLAHADLKLVVVNHLSVSMRAVLATTITLNDDTLRLPSPEQRNGQQIAYDDGLVKAMVQWVDNFLNTR